LPSGVNEHQLHQSEQHRELRYSAHRSNVFKNFFLTVSFDHCRSTEIILNNERKPSLICVTSTLKPFPLENHSSGSYVIKVLHCEVEVTFIDEFIYACSIEIASEFSSNV
jgi:hypothetical protein